MTVDNRGGLATYSQDVNPNKVRLLEDFLVPGACIDLGCGSGAYGDVIATRCDELLRSIWWTAGARRRRAFRFAQWTPVRSPRSGERSTTSSRSTCSSTSPRRTCS